MLLTWNFYYWLISNLVEFHFLYFVISLINYLTIIFLEFYMQIDHLIDFYL